MELERFITFYSPSYLRLFGNILYCRIAEHFDEVIEMHNHFADLHQAKLLPKDLRSIQFSSFYAQGCFR